MQRKGTCSTYSFLCDLVSSRFAAAVAMSAVYDYEPQTREDPMVKVVDDFCHASLPSLTPEKASLLRMFPFCEFFRFEFKGH